MRLPEFTAERALARPSQVYRGKYAFGAQPPSLQAQLAPVRPSQFAGMMAAPGAGADVEIVSDDALGDGMTTSGVELPDEAGAEGASGDPDAVDLPDESALDDQSAPGNG
ncbi:MAG TPA: hypothetical protein VNA89_02470 [Gemmatimonadaceae bacterium]|nr:hypothetical protein [Gemmatimonadaceae bacterium]